MLHCRIVLIEDNPADVHLIKLALNEQGFPYELIRFQNGEEAVAALCSGGPATPPQPDAILLDLNTPKSDGFDVLEQLKKEPRLGGFSMAIITSSQAKSDRLRSSATGALRYIEKPSQLDDFLRTVGSAVQELLTAPDVREKDSTKGGKTE